jgi:hypothetical protein
VTLDFNHRPTVADMVNKAIDRSFYVKPKTRGYLGASEIGNQCNRSVQLGYSGAEPDGPISARTQRIFDRGHWGEAYMVKVLEKAGFMLETADRNGKQFGYTDMGGRFQGHTDGLLFNTPKGFPIMPVRGNEAIWENKVVGQKSFRAITSKADLKVSKPEYYVQVLLYQGYLGKTDWPALFTALNADTMEIHAELVPFDVRACQAEIDRAAMILNATEHRELMPRIAENQDAPACLFCKFKADCKADTLP